MISDRITHYIPSLTKQGIGHVVSSIILSHTILSQANMGLEISFKVSFLKS